jgi:hypothetical protein
MEEWDSLEEWAKNCGRRYVPIVDLLEKLRSVRQF